MSNLNLVDKLTEKLSEKYPNLTKEEIRETVADKLQEKMEDVDWDQVEEDVQQNLEEAAHGEDDFEHYSDIGVYGVLVMSQRDEHVCKPCLDQDGKVYTLEEAKDDPPIPHDACENDECRCSYLPIMDEETFEEEKASEPDLSNLYD